MLKYSYQLERYSEGDDEAPVFDLVIEYEMEPTEYVGGYLYAAGGPTIESVTDTSTGLPFLLTKDEEEEILRVMDREGITPCLHYYPAFDL